MSPTTPLVQHLLKTTGLPREQALKLYRAGYPWPLRTIYEVRKAGIIAQAEGLLFSAALEKAESMTEEQAEAYSDSLNGDDRAKGQGTSREVDAALASLPYLQEVGDHVERVAADARVSCRTVFRLSVALQSYAQEHPGWELHHMCVGRRPS
ncbi:hypothetical protein ACYX34_08565 [Nitrospira sp. CMX1]